MLICQCANNDYNEFYKKDFPVIKIARIIVWQDTALFPSDSDGKEYIFHKLIKDKFNISIKSIPGFKGGIINAYIGEFYLYNGKYKWLDGIMM